MTDIRAQALFCSPLQPSEEPSGMQVRLAVDVQHGLFTRKACAATVAQAYGEDQALAVARIRWCRTAVEAAFVHAPA